jgi:hypothetical protein
MTTDAAKRRGMLESPALPHSWDFSTWPASVFPGSGARAKYLFRIHRSELLAAGACARVGRTIVFLGEGYARFLRKGAARVAGFEVNARRCRAI